MKEYFQAKDIQLILEISKIRYEYLASKIGIKPGKEEVEGTGKAHLWTFKNLFEFALAHNANKLGLPLREVKKLFEYLEDYQENVGLNLPPEIEELKKLRTKIQDKAYNILSESEKKIALSELNLQINSISNEWKLHKLFASGIDINVSIYCAYYGEFLVIFIRGSQIRYYHSAIEKLRELKKLLKNSTGKNRKEHGRQLTWTLVNMGRWDPFNADNKGSIPDMKSLNELLDESDGYLKINLGRIKNLINRRLEYE